VKSQIEWKKGQKIALCNGEQPPACTILEIPLEGHFTGDLIILHDPEIYSSEK
jgi:hypothetical protein